MQLQIARLGLFLILSAVTVVGVAILVFSSLSSQTVKTLSGFRTNPNSPDMNQNMYLKPLPLELYQGQGELTVAAATISLIFGYVAIGLTVWVWPKRKEKVESARLPWTVFLSINALLATAAVTYAFVTHGMTSVFDPAVQDPSISELLDGMNYPAYGPSGAYSSGHFDLESWFCSLANANLPGAKFEQAQLQRICSLQMEIRILLVPLSGLSILAVFFGLWGMALPNKNW